MSVSFCPRGGWAVPLLLLGWLTAGCAQRHSIEVIDEAAYAEAIKENHGKVVLVDFWATWCPGCIKLFPHTVALHERFGSQGLAVIGVSLDDPEDDSPVASFLSRQNAAFPNFISQYGSGSQSVGAFEIDNGEIPHFKLYDRKGNLYRTFHGADLLDPSEIDRTVQQLLQET